MADGEEMAECDSVDLTPDCGCPDCHDGFAAAFAYGRSHGQDGLPCIPETDFHYIQTTIDFAECPDYLEGFRLGWLHGCNNPASTCVDDCKCAENPDDE